MNYQKRNPYIGVARQPACMPHFRLLLFFLFSCLVTNAFPGNHRVENEAPVATAGADTTILLPANSAFLSGNATDADGFIATYTWIKISGPDTGAISQPDSASTAVTDLAPGIYVFQLTVADNDGATATDEIQVIVAAPVVAYAGKDTLIYKNQTRPDSAFLNGRGSTSGAVYYWEVLNGPSVPVIHAPDSAASWVTGMVDGFYQFKLTVNDLASDTVTVFVRDWQQKGVYPCRTGYDTATKTGGLKIVLEPNYKGTYLKPDGTRGTWNQWNFILNVRAYVQSTKNVTLSGGDTLLLEGADSTVWIELGGFGGGKGCPVYVMPRTKPVRIRGTASFFRIATRDSNVVQHVVVDGTVLRGAGHPYGFIFNNSGLSYASNGAFNGGWLANFTLKGLHSTKTNALKIKLDPSVHLFSRYDKFVQRNIVITDNWIDSSSVEGLYIGSSASDGGQLSNPYGPPLRMDSVEISNNIVTNCAWDGIQLANAKNGSVIKHNLIYKAGTANMASQRAGILMGGNTTGVVDSNIIINSKGNGIQVFGYGTVNVHHNIIDSIYGGKGDQDGIYQSFITFASEPTAAPLQVYNYNNLIGRVERNMIRVANNNGRMQPGRTHHNTFIHPTATSANSLIVTNVKDVLDNNVIVSSFPYKLHSINTQDGQTTISITQGDTTQTFSSVKTASDWLFKRLNGVSPSNVPPVVNAGPDVRIPSGDDSVSIEGAATDEDGSIKSYEWRKVNGPTEVVFETPFEPRTFVRNLVQGSYQFELAVTDNGNGIGRDTITITVNTPPLAHAGKDTMITLPVSSIFLNGIGIDPDGSIGAVRWTKLSGPATHFFQDANALQTTVDSLGAGTYLFELQITDNNNARASDTVIVTVNVPPTVSAGPDQTITLPATAVLLQGNATDADGFITSVEWTKLSEPASCRFQNASAAETGLDSLVTGTYIFLLTATDDQSASISDTVSITVLPAPNKIPIANAGMDKTIALPTNSITLSGSGTDGDGTVTAYHWTKLSGPTQGTIATAQAATTTISGLTAGSYIFRFTVTDNNGATGSDDVAVVVKSAPVTTSKYVKVNVYGGVNPYASTAWNNWNIRTALVTNVSSSAFKYTDGSLSTISALLSHSTNVTDNGSTYGSGMAPAQVLRYTSYYTGTRTLTIKGLKTSKKYGIELYASRNASGSSTIFTINGVSRTIATYKNLTNKAVFSNLSPNSSGQIVISISKTGSFNYINGFYITENTTTTTAGVIASGSVLYETTEMLPDTTSIEMYPNPATNKVVLKLHNNHIGIVTVRIVTTSGHAVKSVQFVKGQPLSWHALLVSDLAAGLYLINVQIGGWSRSGTFVKL